MQQTRHITQSVFFSFSHNYYISFRLLNVIALVSNNVYIPLSLYPTPPTPLHANSQPIILQPGSIASPAPPPSFAPHKSHIPADRRIAPNVKDEVPSQQLPPPSRRNNCLFNPLHLSS